MNKNTLYAAPILAAVAMFPAVTMGQNRTDAGQAGRPAQTDNATTAGDRAGAADRGDGATAGQQQKQGMDAKFAEKISDVNNFEIQAGRLASEKASRDEIKQLAKMIVDDHTQAQEKLQAIAQKNSIQLSSQLTPVHQAMLTELSKLDGQEFERAYLYGQIGGHMKTALKLRDAQSELQSPELKRYAGEILPKVRQHLAHAEQLANANEVRTAGARIGGQSGGSATDRDSSSDAGSTGTGTGATDRLRSAGGDPVSQPPADRGAGASDSGQNQRNSK